MIMSALVFRSTGSEHSGILNIVGSSWALKDGWDLERCGWGRERSYAGQGKSVYVNCRISNLYGKDYSIMCTGTSFIFNHKAKEISSKLNVH